MPCFSKSPKRFRMDQLSYEYGSKHPEFSTCFRVIFGPSPKIWWGSNNFGPIFNLFGPPINLFWT